MLENENKKTGYDFWKETLGSPRYVAAPMVDMSELSFRLLCRRYNSQLCYTPMINSHQYLQDEAYRKFVFTTCSKDRPLIAQFCANDPEIFVMAGKMVAQYCDAIDLNLGCPQGIARKGHYGAFLQDDFELIEKLVSHAAKEFPVPITCKVRILPGPIEKTINYAKMLERAGCSMISVHGRTREQKGDETGLASWDAIKAVKENVTIPVLANGNILNFEDIRLCLEYTKADGIMCAEGLLHNPALFTGETPLIWDMTEEYLVLAEEHQTPSKIVRTHLFRLLQYSLEELQNMRECLAHSSTIDEFRTICFQVKEALQSRATNEFERSVTLHNIRNSVTEEKVAKHCDNLSKSVRIEDTSDWIKTGMFSDELDEIISDNVEEDVHDQHLSKKVTPYHLPIWLCHSRPRSPLNSETKKKSDGAKIGLPNDGISKNEKRRQRYLECRLKGKKLKRKDAKVKRKEKQKLKIQQSLTENPNRVCKKDKLALIKKRLLDAKNGSLKVCIDLDFTEHMSNKEQQRLCSQMCRAYGSNRASMKPLHLHFTNLKPCDPFYQLCCDKNDGFLNYVVDMNPHSAAALFPSNDIVYLTPDSPNVLETIHNNKIYVIGGFVDDTVQKNVTLRRAQEIGITTCRLPITEFLDKACKGSFCQVLAVNQVFDILLKFYETGDWVTSLLAGVPQRKGFVAASSPAQSEKSFQTLGSDDVPVDGSLNR